jgi:hypothetical protein
VNEDEARKLVGKVRDRNRHREGEKITKAMKIKYKIETKTMTHT